MHTFMKFTRSFPFQMAILSFLILITLYWSFNGLSWYQRNKEGVTEAECKILELTKKLERKDPQTAAKIAQLRRSHNENALAATLMERNAIDGIDGLPRLAKEGDAYDLRLATFGTNPSLIANADQRGSFLHAHANHLGVFEQVRWSIDNDSLRNSLLDYESRYLSVLDTATQAPDLWRRVRENPMMVYLLMNTDDPVLLDFYDKEQEWLDDVLYLLHSAIDPDDRENISLISMESHKDDTIGRILSTIRVNHPFFRDAVKEYLADPEVDPEAGLVAAFSLFENHGDTIRYCAQKKSIPLDELLDVLFANSDYCEKYADISPEQFAAKLINIRNQMPDVWKNHNRPLVFQLSDDVPHLANSLCENYGTDDIAAFIYLNYDDAVPQTAAAIDKFGDLAIHILNKYSLSDTFRQHMTNSSLGVRIIPYVAQFEDKGLERLDENTAWLDKYFDRDGNPKEEDWWRNLPGGSAVGIAKNWATGVPSEWNEIGWAALDVADATLLVLSLGSSAPASVAKSSATTTTKVGSRAISKGAVSSVLKSGTRSTKQGARTALKSQQKSLLRQSITKSAGTSLRLVARTVGESVRWVAQTSKILVGSAKWVADRTYQAAKSINTTWKNVPPRVRRATYRALLTTGLAVTLIYRTFPLIRDQLPVLGQKIGEFMGETVQTAGETVAAMLNGFLEKMLGPVQEVGTFRARTLYLIVLILLLAVTFFHGKRTWAFWQKRYA